jgi:hypothetical protein
MDSIHELVEVHEVQKRAHLEGDADLFATTFGPTIHEASGGTVGVVSWAEMRERFVEAFSRIRYLVYEDVERPLIRVDGDAAWMLVHVRAARTTFAGEPVPGFEAAWIGAYQRIDGRWLLVAISSSIAEHPTAA